MKHKFFKAVAYGLSVPLDADEIEKVAMAAAKGRVGLLFLKQGMVDMRSPVHIVPDLEREKKYFDSPYDGEKQEIGRLDDAFGAVRERLSEKLSLEGERVGQLGEAKKEEIKEVKNDIIEGSVQEADETETPEKQEWRRKKMDELRESWGKTRENKL